MISDLDIATFLLSAVLDFSNKATKKELTALSDGAISILQMAGQRRIAIPEDFGFVHERLAPQEK